MNNPIIKYLSTFFVFIILGSVIYSNTLEVPFLFDDKERILNNHSIRITGLSPNKLWKAAFGKHSAQNRPIGNITFALNYYFHQYNLFGYHLVNIVIHLVNGILLFLFVRITLRVALVSHEQTQTISTGLARAGGWREGLDPSYIAFFAALVWLVHPVHTQSVTYIIQRLNSLTSTFYLLSFIFYIKGRLDQRKRSSSLPTESSLNLKSTRLKKHHTSQASKGDPRASKRCHYLFYIGSALAWVLALGCKQTAATLPFFIFLYEWYFFQALSGDWLKRSLRYVLGLVVLFGLISFIYLGINPWERITALRDYADNEFTITERGLTQFRVVIYYLSLLFFPHPSRLNLDYDFPLSYSFVEPFTTLLSLVLIIGLIGMAVYLVKKDRLISFSILWFFGNLVIESSVIPLAIIFEHRTYLPSMLVFLIVVLVASRYIKQRWFVAGLLCVIVLFFSIWTYQRNSVWKSAVSLWSDNVKKSENKARPRNNLGNALFRKGVLEDSIVQYREALRIKPEYANAHNNLGLALARQGNIAEAMNHFSEALRIKADYAKAHYNLGLALANQGSVAEAMDHFFEAIRINPGYAKPHYSLGVLVGREGNLDGAIGYFSEAIRVDPGYAQAHYALGLALSNQGNLEEAVKHYSEALRFNPNHKRARSKLESTLRQMDKSGR
jgi:tetratricopeptide (TPR) repeat protein